MKWIILFSLLTVSFRLVAQDSLPKFKANGVLVGYGKDIYPEFRYHPIFFIADFSWQFLKKRRRHFLTMFQQPQFNLVATSRPTDIEFGSNGGLRLHHTINDGLYIYEMAGSGPHFITGKTPRQVTGFIFTNVLALGFLKRVDKHKNLFLQFQAQFRHISNAGLNRPNAGINTYNVVVGLSRMK